MTGSPSTPRNRPQPVPVPPPPLAPSALAIPLPPLPSPPLKRHLHSALAPLPLQTPQGRRRRRHRDPTCSGVQLPSLLLLREHSRSGRQTRIMLRRPRVQGRIQQGALGCLVRLHRAKRVRRVRRRRACLGARGRIRISRVRQAVGCLGSLQRYVPFHMSVRDAIGMQGILRAPWVHGRYQQSYDRGSVCRAKFDPWRPLKEVR